MFTIARLLLVSVMIAVFGLTCSPAATAVPSILDPRYFAGINVPWYNYACDFGCGTDTTNSSPPCQWGCGTGQGVSAPEVNRALADRFSQLQAANVHTVRWFMFEGDPWQIARDDSGPLGLLDAVYADLDAALALAERYDLAVNLVLFEGPSKLPPSWMADPGQRKRLADALVPMFSRYADNPRILAWEIFNEPDSDVFTKNIPLQPVQDTVRLLASAIHTHTGNMVTVGTAHADGIWPWIGMSLDFQQAHWYPHLNEGSQCVPCTDAASIATANGVEPGVPIVVGEFWDPNQLKRLNEFRNKGFAGAWTWSLFPERAGPAGPTMPGDIAALRHFTSGAVGSS